MNFMDKFPKIPYDINKSQYSNFDNITDLTFRFSIVKDVINNIAAYYEYDIREGETPEILADRVYGDPEAYWIILYANDIYDPQYDWPMNGDTFEKYIIGKYGSISQAKATIHHYEKIIGRRVNDSETIYIDRQVVDYTASNNLTCTLDNTNANTAAMYSSQEVLQKDSANNTIFEGYVLNYTVANNFLELAQTSGKLINYVDLIDKVTSSNLGRVVSNSQEYYDYYLNLPADPQYSSYVINNKTIMESISRNAVSNYDYELDLNEQKRLIKVIKKEYYGQIMNEFVNITKSTPGFYRKLR